MAPSIRKSISVIFVLFWFASLASLSIAEQPEKLLPLKVLPINGPKNFQPSGLSYFEQKLIVVSDKHDHTVFQLQIHENEASVLPFLALTIPQELSNNEFDWEGITVDRTNKIYLISEKLSTVFTVSPSEPLLQKLPLDFLSAAQRQGLLKRRNAGLEGICLINDNTLLLAAERQKRGIIEVKRVKSETTSLIFPVEKSKYTYPLHRDPDFADLCTWNNRIFAIERNADMFVELLKSGDCYAEGMAWSFSDVLTAPQYIYEDMRYGMAEGLYIDDRQIYVILDNNGIRRKKDPEDNRPLLLIFEIPSSLRK